MVGMMVGKLRAGLLLAATAGLLLLAAAGSGGGQSESELLAEGLYIVPQVNVLTGAGQRPPQASAGGPAAGRAGPGQPQKAAGKKASPAAAPKAAPKSGLPEHKGVRASALARKTTVKLPKHHWTKAQEAVQASVERSIEAEKLERERSFSQAAKKQYAKSRAAALKHEAHRQARFSSRRDIYALRGREQVDAVNSKDYEERNKLRGRRQSVLYDMAQEKDAEDAGAAKSDHSKDLSWQH